jgi:uncharacterized protein (DUF433 family)
MRLDEIIEVDPEKMSGIPVFRGTRVPIKTLFDYLEGGDSVKVFLDDFPTVDREQAFGLIEVIRRRLLAEYASEYEIAA